MSDELDVFLLLWVFLCSSVIVRLLLITCLCVGQQHNSLTLIIPTTVISAF